MRVYRKTETGYRKVMRALRPLAPLASMLLIALPVLRVALTTSVFLFERDYLFAAISGIYYTIPNIRQRFISVAPGALIVVAAWLGAATPNDYCCQ